MKKLSIISIFTGLVLLFVLQLVSYINALFIQYGLYGGNYFDSNALLKTPLIVIPTLFIIAGIAGLVYEFYRIKDKK